MVRRSALAGLLVLILAGVGQGPAAGAGTFADPAFEQAGMRADRPVAEGRVARSWLWGDTPFAGGYEPYADAPGGQRLVQYLDKARMEINNPAAAPSDPYYVTNGLLVVELLSGRLQVGNNQFTPYVPAAIAVAGDNASANPDAPTYAAFARVATLVGSENQAADATGAPADNQIAKDGTASKGDAGGVTYARYEPATHHNIAAVFWRFMTARGLVYRDNQFVEDQLFDWLAVMGYPVSEPYWATVKIGGQDRRVLIQMFQRRVLTYNPVNTPDWQVEMGNVGRHYADWRQSLGVPLPTGGIGPAPTPPPNATPGSGSGALRDWFSRADQAMNALTAMKGRSASHNIQNDVPVDDFADYAWEAPDKFYVKVRSPRPGVSPDPVAEQLRIGNQFYQRINNAPQWDVVTTTDTYRWPAYNYPYLGEHADAATLAGTETVDGTPCQIVRVVLKNSKGEVDRTIDMYLATTDATVRREVTTASATSEHPPGTSTTDFYDFNVPNHLTAPTNVK
jgi:hypothetical protein